MSDVFTQPKEEVTPEEPKPAEDTDNPVELLVGEGRKFKTVEDLAKGKLESDRYIEEQNQKLAEAEARLKVMDELVDKGVFKQPQTDGDPNGGTPPPADPPEEIVPPVGITEEDLERILADREVAKQESQNLKTVESNLVEELGSETEVQSFLVKQSKELGMSLEELRNEASKRPQAFYRLVGLGGTKRTNNNVTAPRGEQRTDVTPKPDELSTYSGIRARITELDRNPTRANQREKTALEKRIYKLSAQHGREWLQS